MDGPMLIWTLLLSHLAMPSATPVADLAKFGRLLPFDESAKDAGFNAYKKRFLLALEQKDSAYVFAQLDPKILVDFGSTGQGVQAFRDEWLDCRTCDFWKEAKAILSMGCTRQTAEEVHFACPYVFQGLPEDKDGFSWEVVISKDVPVYADSSTRSKILARASYSILPRVAGGNAKWFRVDTSALASGGYLEKRFVRSPVDVRILFAKRDSKWKVIMYVGGD